MFITQEDPRASIKGSRDPLGLQPIWSQFGRYLVANLTTQSNSVRGFTVLLLGRYLGEKLVFQGLLNEEDMIGVFLRVEQICAHVRHREFMVDGDIRGIERVRTVRNEDQITISTGRDGQILSDQRLYGLWGLFSVPAKISGLVTEDGERLTLEATSFVDETYWPKIAPYFRHVRDSICNDSTTITSKTRVYRTFKSILSNELTTHEREFYAAYLRDGQYVRNNPLSSQGLLARFVSDLPNELSIGRNMFLMLKKKATEAKDESLAYRLEQIIHAEAVYAIASLIFEHLQTRDGSSVEQISTNLNRIWNRIPNISYQSNKHILEDINKCYRDGQVALQFDACQRALQKSRFDDVIRTLIEWNALIQRRRSGSQWIRLDRNDRLEVKYRNYDFQLPSQDELDDVWRYDYYLASLRNIINQLVGKEINQ